MERVYNKSNNVEYDDLVGYGTFGLIDAIDKFDYDKGVKLQRNESVGEYVTNFVF